MKKIMILHRSDLFNLTSDLPIQEVEAEHFKIQIKDFNSASFIAFEEDGLLKILKNDRGACVTIPCASLLMAVEMVTKQEAIRANFPKDAHEEYFRPDYKDITPESIAVSLDGDYKQISEGEISMVDKRTGELIIPPLNYRFELADTPGPRFILGYDPAAKDQPDPKIGMYMKCLDDPNGPFVQVANYDSNLPFKEEVMKTAQFYGHHLLEDYNDEINSSVASAIELTKDPVYLNNPFLYPQTLTQAILAFLPNFNDIPVIAFQHTEIHFTTTFKIKYPEIYAALKKECGFWCEDTLLYKNLSTIYKCDHEACLLNIILKGIYRYRNTGRDRSGDFKDIINSYKPE